MGATDAQQITLLKGDPVSPQERDKLAAEVAPDMTSSCLQSLSPPFGGLWEMRDPIFHWLAPVARRPPPLRGSCKPTRSERWAVGHRRALQAPSRGGRPQLRSTQKG